jgi:hypothetical protein
MSNWTSDVRSRSRSSSDLDSKVWLFKSQISIKFTFLYYLYILVDISCNEYSPNQKKTIKKGKTSFKSLSTLWLSRRRRSRNPKIQRNCAKIFCIEAHPDRSINEEWTGRKLIILNDDQQDATILVYLFILLLYMLHMNEMEVSFHLVHDTGRQQHRCTISEAVNTVKCSWWWAKTSPETCRTD